MKRIGILTFHRAHNYGAVLQAYALQQCLVGLGFEVQFIDYKNKQLLEVYDLINLRRMVSKNPVKLIKKSLDEVTSFIPRLKRSRGFDAFISERLNIESNVSYEHINEYFDVVFIGSDQVWNFHLTYGFDPYYWGNFKNTNSNLVLASYAASMEVADLTKNEEVQIGTLLKNFDSISVREDSLKNTLNRLTDKEITVVADPTLLVDVSIWDSIAVKPARDKKYLLLYQVRNNVNNENLAKKIAGILDLEVVYLSARLDAINSKECIDASPADYLGLFKHASFVLCSSFHGTVFSILFKVPFYAIMMNDGKDSRNISLLNFLGLIGRGVSYDIEYKDEAIDWQDVTNRLELIKKGSIDFIKSVVK
jgi:hypothetical protein